MKTLYLDCGMGAAGDMLTAALTELLPDPEKFMERLNSLNIPGVRFSREKSVKCGITGTHISVTVNGVEEGEHEHHHHHDHDHHEHEHHHEHYHDHYEDTHGARHHHDHSHDHEHTHEHDHHEHGHHHHSSMHDIEHIVGHLDVSPKVREDILAVYGLIAEAESHAHDAPVTEIHFHEVGTMDAVADVAAVCMLMEELSPDEIAASPVHVGSGQVKCAHGILPVPAPATAYILRDVPIYGGKIDGELCTPTGAALLKHFVTRFGDMPVMKTTAIGYGMGKKDFPRANCLRAMLGETSPGETSPWDTEDKTDVVLELSCNVDDMTAEAIGFAMERLFEGGAKEVYTIPIGMKKSRPGTLIRVMCRSQDREKIIGLLFRHTTTIGVREAMTRRYVLDRKIETVQTPYGEVQKKISSGYGVSRVKYEYDDISKIARENNMSLDDVKKIL
ncbi:MAG: nickel pincer cofactor biosynthesis protein LarC [Oscillospiraceae bacterium]|nr:nickel pincer cofactor biosynthesis protein LarC [Oscillospiraceae bacterium]